MRTLLVVLLVALLSLNAVSALGAESLESVSTSSQAQDEGVVLHGIEWVDEASQVPHNDDENDASNGASFLGDEAAPAPEAEAPQPEASADGFNHDGTEEYTENVDAEAFETANALMEANQQMRASLAGKKRFPNLGAALKKAGNAIKNGAKKVGGAIKKVAKKVGGAIKKGAKALGKGLKKLAKGALSAALKVGKFAGKFLAKGFGAYLGSPNLSSHLMALAVKKARLLEHCSACRFIWKSVEMDIGNMYHEKTIFDSFLAECKQAMTAPIFYTPCQMMLSQVDSMVSAYAAGYSVNKLCTEGRLCR